MSKLTEAQKSALQTVQMWAVNGTYMPYANQAATFEACVRKGVLIYRRVDDGYTHNGYELTELGRSALKEIT